MAGNKKITFGIKFPHKTKKSRLKFQEFPKAIFIFQLEH